MSIATDTGADMSANRGILLGCATSFVAIIGGHFIYPASAPVSDAIPDRLTCYLPYLAAVAAPLMIGLIQLGRSRFAALASTPIHDARALEHNDYVQTTVALMLPAVLVHLSLLATLPYAWLNIAPLMAIWFVIASLVFLVGYRRPAARAFGFAAALAPSVVGALAVPVLSVWNALT
ncbi:hypothetical protein [Devosia sediminis]|uniref:Uncharacterized protein n=1 Tax=Devosia sediminis TaxID=2798801 RepID=A0A934MPV1_9HYPH|nr:hypothetical protein [Devosia sediminis]MBJ3783709.1 hypothetical protein [Devosia sediminis]